MLQFCLYVYKNIQKVTSEDSMSLSYTNIPYKQFKVVWQIQNSSK